MTSLSYRLSSAFVITTLAFSVAADPQGVEHSATRAASNDAANGWHVERDATTGLAGFLYGGGERGPWSVCNGDDAAALAWLALVETAELHGVELETLELDRALLLPLSWTTDKWTVRFRQVVAGVPVHLGTTNVLLGVDGTPLSIDVGALPGLRELPGAPILDAAAGHRRARELFSAQVARPSNAGREPTLEIYPREDASHRVPLLTWRVDQLREVAGEDPVGFRYWIDATDGSLVARESLTHGFDVSGTVYTYTTEGIGPDDDDSTTVKVPLAHVEITAEEGGQPISVFSDVDGTYVFPGANTVTDLEIRYDGEFARVGTDFGFATKVQEATVSGAGNDFTLNTFNGGPPNPSNLGTPQANAYVVATKLRDWIRSVNPGDDTADFQAQITVNIGTSKCSAGKYSNLKVSLYRDVDQHPENCPSGANNASYSTIIAHEMGHWLSYLYGSGFGTHMKEGNADVFAMYLFDTPDVFFDYFVLSPGPGRTGENTTAYAGHPYGDIYESGEVWMGVAWKMRRNLHFTYPHPPGQTSMADTVADALFLGWMNAFDQIYLEPKVLKQWLLLDDDDATLCNGTPHFLELESAFFEQGFPAYTPPFYCTNFDVLAAPQDDPDEVGPYLVSAEVEADPSLPLTGVSLWYAVDGGASTELPMAPPTAGDVWEASIPGQVSPARVTWFLAATDITGGVAFFPEDAPARAFDFHVGRFAPVFFDDFEVDRGWTVIDENVDAGSGERGDPVGTPLQPEDDFTAEGTHCWVTGQAQVDGRFEDEEVKGGPTRLISPRFDFWGHQPFVELAWWVSNPLGDDELHAEISYDDGASWNDLASFRGGDDGAWTLDRLTRVDGTTSTDQVRFRFSVADSPDDSHLEAAIDELTAWALIPSDFCPPPTNYCEALPNSVGPGATISASGSTSVAANDFGLLVQNCPPQQFGLFFYGPNQDHTPWGEGVRCAKGGVVRLPPALQTDAAGAATVTLDLTQPPVPNGQITVGSTWHFQFWHRDPTGGPEGFNLSDGLRATFCQ